MTAALHWSKLMLGLVATVASASFAVADVAKPAKPAAPAQNLDLINDSLVKNLKCSTLRLETVLRSLQPDAFSSERHIPLRNWPSGNGLAQCWALSHAQRITFFMGRFGQSANPQKFLAPKYLEPVENMFSGSSEQPLAVFPVPSISSLVSALSMGFTDQSGNARNFRSDIEAYQSWRFYQLGNTAMIMGSRDRDPSTNAESFESIKANLSRGRIPMVVLRPSLTGQHVVLIKKMYPSTAAGIVNFDVYDSNFPTMDNHIYYDRSRQEFHAPQVIIGIDADAYSPIGLFVVDSQDMDTIESQLFDYYVGRCRALTKRSTK